MPQKKTFRYVSSMKLLGCPLLSVAMGPDESKGELRGWAHGIIAIGDFATGLIAIGGIAGGGISVGGISVGCLSVGGVSLGGLILGGVAIGYVAFGGVAIGHYAKGGAAVGTYVVSKHRQDPEAVRLFNSMVGGKALPADTKASKVDDTGNAKSTNNQNAPPADTPDAATSTKER